VVVDEVGGCSLFILHLSFFISSFIFSPLFSFPSSVLLGLLSLFSFSSFSPSSKPCFKFFGMYGARGIYGH